LNSERAEVCQMRRRFSSYLERESFLRKFGKIDVALSEVQQQNVLIQQLKTETCPSLDKSRNLNYEEVGLSKADYLRLLDSSMTSCCLHVESRKASALQMGFYTIGPCGEELLSPIGMILKETDALALHYRHLSASVARQLVGGKSIEDIIMDRARGHTVSSLDPVSGGGHCCLGGLERDFLVTSTLASQSPPAVGRALGFNIARRLLPKENWKFPSDAISVVTVGDGSVNNAHFLSAVNMAEYVYSRNFKCPIVFGISNNDRCISLPGHGWLSKFVDQRLGMPTFHCNGLDLLDVYDTFARTVRTARSTKGPSLIVFDNLPRRFGHAATDRQAAYLTPDQIERQADHPLLAPAIRQAVESGVESYQYFHDRYLYIKDQCLQKFALASAEPKLTSTDYVKSHNSQPLVHVTRGPEKKMKRSIMKKGDVMRKLMNEGLKEILATYAFAYYLGEDVTHGGYYLVTDGIQKEYPKQIADFPPDETSIMGCAMGFAQCGLLPIIEIPYAKYLDCAADMFFEAIIMNWLSASKQPNGMIIRLQGFGVGVFGGNFHTHNMLHIPPGLDVVCYSNGYDYVRGMRYLVEQAKNGRVCMSVDSTHLLNERHLHDKDEGWLMKYPEWDEVLDFDTVMKYEEVSEPRILVVTYGSGVLFSLRAAKTLRENHDIEICVIDCPLLSGCPKMLKEEMKRFDKVVFADLCKKGSNPLSYHVTVLQDEGLLPSRWSLVGSHRTYNPLGTTLTFLNDGDIVDSVRSLCDKDGSRC